MSFGWSVTDVVAGCKFVYQVWKAVSEGPRNANYEATEFFHEFQACTDLLAEWEQHKNLLYNSNSKLKDAHNAVYRHCTVFLDNHLRLIQNSTKQATRPDFDKWLGSIDKERVIRVYQQMKWPTEKATLDRLRRSLDVFINIATAQMGLVNVKINRETLDIVREMKLEQQRESQRMTAQNRELAYRVAQILKKITRPLDPADETSTGEIDYIMLRQLVQALEPPQPLRAIDWHSNSSSSTAVLPITTPENRTLISSRLDNISIRVKREHPLRTIPESESRESLSSTTEPLKRLHEMRDEISQAVGVRHDAVPQEGSSASTQPGHAPRREPESLNPLQALRQELDEWNTLHERLERKIIHPSQVLLPQQTDVPSSPKSGKARTWPHSPSASSSSGGHHHPKRISISNAFPSISVQL